MFLIPIRSAAEKETATAPLSVLRQFGEWWQEDFERLCIYLWIVPLDSNPPHRRTGWHLSQTTAEIGPNNRGQPALAARKSNVRKRSGTRCAKLNAPQPNLLRMTTRIAARQNQCNCYLVEAYASAGFPCPPSPDPKRLRPSSGARESSRRLGVGMSPSR